MSKNNFANLPRRAQVPLSTCSRISHCLH